MSVDDFWAGRQAANFANRAAMVDADEAIAEWKAYSEKLKIELAKTDAVRAGLVCLRKRLCAELQRFDPNNPLLVEDEQANVIRAGYYDKLESLGYVVDRKDGTFRKRS